MEDMSGGVADREPFSSSPKLRAARGDCSSTGGVEGSLTVASGVGCGRRASTRRVVVACPAFRIYV